MKFYSTNNSAHRVHLPEAVLNGLAPDNGLYMPERIPVLSHDYFSSLASRSFQEIAFDVASVFVEDAIPHDLLKRIIDHTISFDAPLVEIERNVLALELFHGPTLAFKDFGARFMSQLLSHFAQQQNREIVILVATSGDTGSAVANGFLGVEGTRVVVLYPSGKVSEIQEKQFTTLGQNITAIEVAGTFDDCQKMVKQAFLNENLKSKFFLTSANSINIARLIPQMFYYFYAWSRLAEKQNVVFSVPSGNFGNLTAGLMAQRMGLPVQHFLAATNVNDVVPHYLATKEFLPRQSVSTISNAMDVGHPSNFARMLALYDGDHEAMRKDVVGFAFTDEATQAAMKNVFLNTGYVLDPHAAIGYLGLKEFQATHPDTVGVFLATAHPAKFSDVVASATGTKVNMPERLQHFLNRKKESLKCAADFDAFQQLLVSVLA